MLNLQEKYYLNMAMDTLEGKSRVNNPQSGFQLLSDSLGLAPSGARPLMPPSIT